MSDATDLGPLFGGVVVPEATPSPRTIRFATPPLGDGPSRSFDAAAADPQVAPLFAVSDEVTNVLVGPTFVAVTILHADQWEQLLGPLLHAVTESFTGSEEPTALDAQAPAVLTLDVGGAPVDGAEPRRLERAWTELGAIRTDDGEGLDRLVAASHDNEPARRQVAAVLLGDAAPEAAVRHWTRLLDDPSRSVRRAVVDTMGDAERAELRPLIEHALTDTDAWIRWRALHAIAALGVAPSRTAVEALAADPDFRVRLEAARALAT
ncbi:MAG: HEAT repeat domain-containing protein [Acidimicrobiia bacterium]